LADISKQSLLMTRFKDIFSPDDIPILFIVLNYFILFPIIVWPFTWFLLIFAFDNPSGVYEVGESVAFVLGYPFLLIFSFLLANFLYRRNSILGWIYLLSSVWYMFYFIFS